MNRAIIALVVTAVSICSVQNLSAQQSDQPLAYETYEKIVSQSDEKARRDLLVEARRNRDIAIAVHVRLLQHSDETIRRLAIESCGMMRRRAVLIIDEIVGLLETETDPENRRNVLLAIERISQYADAEHRQKISSIATEKLQNIIDVEPELAIFAIGALIRIEDELKSNQSVTAIPNLVQFAIADSSNEERKIAALKYLSLFQEISSEQVADLLPLLKSESVSLRNAAAATINRVAPRYDAATIDAFLEVLGDDELDRTAQAYPRVWSVSDSAQLMLFNAQNRSVPGLISKLDDSSFFVRSVAAQILIKISPKQHANVVLPIVLESLNSDDAQIVANAARNLGMIDIRTNEVVDALIKTLDDKRETTLMAPSGNSEEVDVPQIFQQFVFESAARTLGMFEDDASAAIPRLVKLIENPLINSPISLRKIHNAILKIDPENEVTDKSFRITELETWAKNIVCGKTFSHTVMGNGKQIVSELKFGTTQWTEFTNPAFTIDSELTLDIKRDQPGLPLHKQKMVWGFVDNGDGIVWTERLFDDGLLLRERSAIVKVSRGQIAMALNPEEIESSKTGEWTSTSWDSNRKGGGSQGIINTKDGVVEVWR